MLYSNIGKKLMTVAKIFAILFTVFGVILGLIAMIANFAAGLLVLVIYPLCGYIGSLSIYASGKLLMSVENIEKSVVKATEANADSE